MRDESRPIAFKHEVGQTVGYAGTGLAFTIHAKRCILHGPQYLISTNAYNAHKVIGARAGEKFWVNEGAIIVEVPA